jgi:hypothetical protein|nr:MAG TPA: tail protein [Caudoviricetes sp.]
MVEKISLMNLVTKKEIVIDKLESPNFILDYIDWGQVSSSRHTFKYTNQVGEIVVSISLETRNIDLSAYILAETEGEMSSLKKYMNNFVNPLNMLRINYNGYVLDFLPDTSIKYAGEEKENNEILCKFKISGLAPDPLFKEEEKNQIKAATTTGKFHFPLAIPNGYGSAHLKPPKGIIFGLRSPASIVAIENKGAVDTGIIVSFRAKSQVVNPQILDIETQKLLKINKTLEAGEAVEINTSYGEKEVKGYLNGEEAINYFKYIDIDSEWLQIKQGTNLLRYQADKGVENLEVTIYFENKFLEVQEC